MDGLTKKYEVIEVLGGSSRQVESYVSIEKNVSVFLNGTKAASLSASPEDLEAFAYGFLICEGLTNSADKIKSVEVDGAKVKIEADVSCSGHDEKICTGYHSISSPSANIVPLPAGPVVDVATLHHCLDNINDFAIQWRRTGGTHCAIIFDDLGGVISYAEDVGRHSAIDKAIGKAIINERKLSRSILVTTGRMPEAIVLKAYRAGIPIVVSNTAPFSSGIDLALKAGMTLVCFARPPRMYIYSGHERVVISRGPST